MFIEKYTDGGERPQWGRILKENEKLFDLFSIFPFFYFDLPQCGAVKVNFAFL
jgi:hypothetical protein